MQVLTDGSFVGEFTKRSKTPKIFKLSLTFFTICKFCIETSRFFIPEMPFVYPTMLHIKKLGAYITKRHIHAYLCAYVRRRIDKIRVYNTRM